MAASTQDGSTHPPEGAPMSMAHLNLSRSLTHTTSSSHYYTVSGSESGHGHAEDEDDFVSINANEADDTIVISPPESQERGQAESAGVAAAPEYSSSHVPANASPPVLPPNSRDLSHPSSVPVPHSAATSSSMIPNSQSSPPHSEHVQHSRSASASSSGTATGQDNLKTNPSAPPRVSADAGRHEEFIAEDLLGRAPIEPQTQTIGTGTEYATQQPRSIQTSSSPSLKFTAKPPALKSISSNSTLSPSSSRPDLLSSLPPPPPFDLVVRDLCIGIPPPSHYLPLPIPIPIPGFLLNKPANVDIDAEDPDRYRLIVNHVSTECHAGEMLAIIGGSGSGKTTLLHAIVGRLANLPIISGEVGFVASGSLSSSSPQSRLPIMTARKIKDRMGFVRQNDYLLPHLTVRETLSYSAALRLPTSVPSSTRELIVSQVISELNLADCADTVVGGLGTLRKGISGGERRRLSIGCVLVTLPSVLCLDEPTTGLDASTAYSLLLTLSRLARSRHLTIVLSIHQPRSDAFTLFDRLILLASGGRTVYSGLRRDVLGWFKTGCGEEYEEGSGVNVLDWLVDLGCVDRKSEESEEASRARIERLVGLWKERDGDEISENFASPVIDPVQASEEEKEETNDDPSTEENQVEKVHDVHLQLEPAVSNVVTDIMSLHAKDDQRPGWLKQTSILTRRAQSNVLRNYTQSIGLAIQCLGLGVLLGCTFYQLDETPSGIQSLKTLLYQQAPCYFYLTLIYHVFRLCDTDLVIFDREREDNLYAVVPYILSDLIAQLPSHIISSTVFTVLIYFMCHLRTDDLAGNLFIFIANNILVQLVVVGFALLTASVERTYATASLISNSLQIFLLLTAGYLIVTPPIWLRWIRWISPFFYSFRILIISQFRDRTFECSGIEGVLTNQCDGNQLIHGLKMPVEYSVGYYFSGLIGLFIVEHILACVILHFYKPGGVKHASKIQANDETGKHLRSAGDIDVPWVRVDVEVKNLCLSWIRHKVGPVVSDAKKDILQDVNLRFPAGEVTAILGPSGAGKSSLLQLLAFRHINPGPFATFSQSGEILFNSQPAKRSMRSLVSFVEQFDDHHYAALTVRETLRYAAILRLPENVSMKRKIARADEVGRMLGLTECADTLVGGPLLKGISGGEKRRLSLAVQMINDPSILIVDEPTSGLDSLTASNVMSALKKIASESGRTVIVTLHQPRSDIYQELDNIVVLVKGGLVAFSGPRESVPSAFTEAGYPIPPLFNPADHLLDTVTRPKRASAMVEFWAARHKLKGLDDWSGRDKDTDPKELVPIDESVLENTNKKTPLHIAFGVVIMRMFKNQWRQQPIFWLRFQQAPLLGCLFWMFYERISHGAEGGQDRIGIIQEFVLPIPFVGLLNNIAIFPLDRDVFLHEYQSSARYSSGTFLLAFTLLELPMQIVSSLLWTILMIIGPGLQYNARIFFEAVVVTLTLQSFGESLGIVFASFFDSMGLNVSLVSTCISVLTQSCGIVSVSVPKWLGIIAWGTVMKSAGRVIAINEFVGLKLNCTSEQVASGACLAQTGEQILQILGFKDLNTTKFVGIGIGIMVVNRLIAWAVLRAKLLTV